MSFEVHLSMLVLTLNLLGLVANFGGTLMMFFANPEVSTPSQLADGKDLRKIFHSRRKTNTFRLGMLVLSLGFILQLIGFVMQNF